MAVLAPMILLFVTASILSVAVVSLNRRAPRGGAVATVTDVLVDRRVHRLVAFSALVVLVIALAMA
jgi:hypothetical protein